MLSGYFKREMLALKNEFKIFGQYMKPDDSAE